jgi:hypothetical protein
MKRCVPLRCLCWARPRTAAAVIPAKAGIHASLAAQVGSRFRGNDGGEPGAVNEGARAERRAAPGQDWLSATAARISAFSAALSILSSTLKSMARRTLPSRLELKRPFGSGSEAPLGKVIFTTAL